jgi:WD40 repeat protein
MSPILDTPEANPERPAAWGLILFCFGLLALVLGAGGTGLYFLLRSDPAENDSGQEQAEGTDKAGGGPRADGTGQNPQGTASDKAEARDRQPAPPDSRDKPAPEKRPDNPVKRPADPEREVVRSKLGLPAMDKLDGTKLDKVLPPPKPEEKPPAVWDGHTNHVRRVAYTPDGKFVISVSGDMNRDVKRPADNSIRVWDARRGQQVHKVEGFHEALDSLSISPGGRFAIFSPGGYWEGDTYIQSKDHGVYLWDIQAKRVIGPGIDLAAETPPAEESKTGARFVGHTNQVFSTAFSPDRQMIVAGANDGQYILWDTNKGNVIVQGKIPFFKQRSFAPAVNGARFTPDGGHQVFAIYDGTVRVYETGKDQAVGRPMESHLDIVWSLDVARAKSGHLWALSGGGWRLRLDHKGFEPGAQDYAVRLWDLDRQQVLRRFAGHQQPVMGLAFCPGGRHFVSASEDGTVRLWDLATGKQLRLLGRHDAGVNSVAVAPNGRSCVSGGRDCKVRFWSLPTGQDLVVALDQSDMVELEKAARDMDVIGSEALTVFPRLMAGLNHKDPTFRRLAAQILGQLVDHCRPEELPFERAHMPSLLQALAGDSPAETQVLAARGLGLVGPAAAEAVPALLKCFEQSRDARIAAAVLEALGRIGVKDRPVALLLAKAVEHQDPTVRVQALQVLARLTPEALPLGTLVEKLGHDPSPEVQAGAEKLLRDRFTSLTVQDVPALRRGLKSRHARACVCCAQAVGQLRADGAGAVPELAALLRRPAREVRLAALAALKACGKAAQGAAPELAALIGESGDPQIDILATATLLQVDPDNRAVVERGVPRLLEALKPKTVEEAKTALSNPLERPATRLLLDIGAPAVPVLVNNGLKVWAPKKNENKDLPPTVARYQAYKIIEELAGRAAQDETLRKALKKVEDAFRYGYLPKEKALVREAARMVQLRRLTPEAYEAYSRTAAAARAAFGKLTSLRAAPAK